MDSYIVKVYRREEAGDSNLAGTVEQFGVEGMRVFRTEKELLEILIPRGGPASESTASA